MLNRINYITILFSRVVLYNCTKDKTFFLYYYRGETKKENMLHNEGSIATKGWPQP